MDASVIHPSPIPVVLDAGANVKKIGLVALSTDLTFERDFHRMCSSDQVGIYAGRVLFENPTTPENLRKMLPRIKDATDLILTDMALDAVCYGCTAATVHIGDDAIREAVQASKPGVPVITPSGAGALGLQALGAKRISVLTPYTAEVSRPFADYFNERGFEVVNLECLGLLDDGDIARVSRQTILEGARSAMRDDADAVFLSCTALRAVECIEEVEQLIGKPAVSSNQASVWLTLRRAGIEDVIPGFGRLLTLGAPD